jgi:signal transduction histidine kinase
VIEVSSSAHSSGARRVWLLTAAVGMTALVVLRLVSADGRVVVSGPHVPWWLLAVGFGFAEIFVMHLRIARHAHSFSLGELPLVVGLALATPVDIVIAQAVGVAIVLAVYRRQSALRIAFNIGQRSLTAVLAVAVFAGTTGAVHRGWVGIWLGAFAAMLLADLVAGVLINAAISLSEGTWMLFDQVVGIGTALTIANTALGIVAVMVVREQPASILLVTLPAATTFLAGKAYADVQRKHDEVLLLERSTRLAQGSLQLEEMLPPLLEHLREMFRADIAELVLSPAHDDEPHLSSRVGPGDTRSMMIPASLDPWQGVWARVGAEREGIVLSRPIRNANLGRFFGAQGIADAVVAPIQSDDELFGTLMVANRLGDFSTFGAEDLKLLETVANHVAVAIRNTQLVRRLEGTLARETEISRLKDDFVATVSHELRTPLTSVKGYIRTLLSPEIAVSEADRREFLQRADRAADRLRWLIEDLLFTSRVEGSRPGVAGEVVSVDRLVDRIIEERAATLEEPGRLVFVGTVGRSTLRTDEEHVYRILSNLVDNALKYSSAIVQVSAREDDGGVRISVEDRGRGIPPEEQGKIFERFYQVDQSSTRLVGGAGMGLYICRKAAERLGGRVWLERSDTSGSLFCLWVPFNVPTAETGSGERGHRLVVVG